MTRADQGLWRRQPMRLLIQQSAAVYFFLCGIVVLSGAEIAAPKKVGSANAPDMTLQPAAQARSLAMLSQVVMQLEHYVQSKDLSAIHNEDVILSAAASELLAQIVR